MSMITLTIDGVQVSVPAGSTVLEAAKAAGIHIPTLCYMKGLNEIGACRLCVVDTGARALQAACVLPVPRGSSKPTPPRAQRPQDESRIGCSPTTTKKCLSCVRSTKLRIAETVQRVRRGG